MDNGDSRCALVHRRVPLRRIYRNIRSREYCRMQIQWELHSRCASIKRTAAYKLNIEKIGLSLTIRSMLRQRFFRRWIRRFNLIVNNAYERSKGRRDIVLSVFFIFNRWQNPRFDPAAATQNATRTYNTRIKCQAKSLARQREQSARVKRKGESEREREVACFYLKLKARAC